MLMLKSKILPCKVSPKTLGASCTSPTIRDFVNWWNDEIGQILHNCISILVWGTWYLALMRDSKRVSLALLLLAFPILELVSQQQCSTGSKPLLWKRIVYQTIVGRKKFKKKTNIWPFPAYTYTHKTNIC